MPPANDIRKEYADTLKEIVQLESKILRLRATAVRLENQLLDEELKEKFGELDIYDKSGMDAE